MPSETHLNQKRVFARADVQTNLFNTESVENQIYSIQMPAIQKLSQLKQKQQNLLTDDSTVDNIWDLETLKNLAKMTNNAYLELNQTLDWFPVDGHHANISFGFDSNGLRGYVYASEDDSLMIITFKGTSASFFGVGGGSTSKNDKLQDNLMFSCCCAKVDRTWWPVCPCAEQQFNSFGLPQCRISCLTEFLHQEDSYWLVAQRIYNIVQHLYPTTEIWVAGHSLGGAVAALTGASLGIPAITFEAPGEQLVASRLGLPIHSPLTWHFGLRSDPIFVGKCNGLYSSCYLAGYAMETKCHTANVCLLDLLPSKKAFDDDHDDSRGVPTDIRTHRIKYVLNILESIDFEQYEPFCHVEKDCQDCSHWEMS